MVTNVDCGNCNHCRITILYFYIQRQLQLMNVQLSQRLHEQYKQPISVELLNKEINQLVANINRILIESQKSRSYIKREEKYYKEMISNISHDFRTPLTAIKGYQQMLLKEPLTEKQLAKLEIAQKHVGRLEQLVETFFEYSYLHSNEDQPKKIVSIYQILYLKRLQVPLHNLNSEELPSICLILSRSLFTLMKKCFYALCKT